MLGVCETVIFSRVDKMIKFAQDFTFLMTREVDLYSRIQIRTGEVQTRAVRNNHMNHD